VMWSIEDLTVACLIEVRYKKHMTQNNALPSPTQRARGGRTIGQTGIVTRHPRTLIPFAMI
jgi:hypothetical protein